MKINQSTFIKDLVIRKKVIKCNANVILIIAGLAIEMTNADNNKETNLQGYQ